MNYIYVFVVICYFSGALAQSTSNNSTSHSDYPELQPEWQYCLEFTWFGPDYDNITHKYNGTCEDYLEDKRVTNVPCSPPIVISNDGTPPNMDYLWENHKTSILCRKGENQKCVKYTFFLDDKVTNITYMCSKVHYETGKRKEGDYCSEQKLDGGYKSEVCVCEPGNGFRYLPCNGATYDAVSLSLIIACIFHLIYIFMSQH